MWLWILLAGVLLAALDWLRKRFFSSLQAFPPAAGMLPFVGHMFLFADIEKVHEVGQKLVHGTHSSASRLNVMGDEILISDDPAVIKTVNTASRYRHMMADVMPFARSITSMPPGPRHSGLRKFFHPFLSGLQYQEILEPTLLKHATIISNELENMAGAFINLDKMMEWAMFDLATDLTMGFNPGTASGDNAQLLSDWALVNEGALFRSVTKGLPYWNYPALTTPYFRRFNEAVERIDKVLIEYVHRCHADAAANPDKTPTSAMQYYFLTPKDSDLEMSDSEVVHTSLNLIWGAVDSTRLIITVAVAEVARHPEILARLRSELDSVMKDNKFPTSAQLSKDMPYLGAVVQEVLRLYPPFPLIPSNMSSDIEVNGARLPAKTEIWNAIHAAHTDPKYWKDPTKFDPERFISGDGVRNPAWNPFGGGSRRCPGERLGLLDVRYFVAALLKQFDFDLKDASQLNCVVRVSFALPNGLDVMVSKRK